MHGHPFDAFVPAVSQTARFCGMRWVPPFVVHGSHRIGEEELRTRRDKSGRTRRAVEPKVKDW